MQRTDKLGKFLKVGDIVVFTEKHYKSLSTGYIERFEGKDDKFIVIYHEPISWLKETETRKMASKVIKLGE